MVDPDQIVSAVLAGGVAACFAYGYLAGRDPGRAPDTVPARADEDGGRLPARAPHCAAARQLRTGRPTADRSPGAARPRVRRRPRRPARWNP